MVKDKKKKEAIEVVSFWLKPEELPEHNGYTDARCIAFTPEMAMFNIKDTVIERRIKIRVLFDFEAKKIYILDVWGEAETFILDLRDPEEKLIEQERYLCNAFDTDVFKYLIDYFYYLIDSLLLKEVKK